jgi:caa(3)-type oxidase subunit IV
MSEKEEADVKEATKSDPPDDDGAAAHSGPGKDAESSADDKEGEEERESDPPKEEAKKSDPPAKAEKKSDPPIEDKKAAKKEAPKPEKKADKKSDKAAKASDKTPADKGEIFPRDTRARVSKDKHEKKPEKAAAKVAAKHGHGHEHHGHAPDRKEYWRIWGWLLALTILEVGVAYLRAQIGKLALVTCLVGLALAKAACVALYYMHLKHESRVMRWTVAFPMIFPALYAFILIAEGAYRAIWGA